MQESAERFSQRGGFCLVTEEMGGGGSGKLEGAHLRKRSCAVMSRPQAVTCKSSIMCTRLGEAAACLFDLSQEQFDNHLSVSQRSFPPGNLSQPNAM